MPPQVIEFPHEFEDRLREWARHFRDRGYRQQSCCSAEKNYKRHSDDFDLEGWGEYHGSAPRAPAASYSVLRAIETEVCLQRACNLAEKWVITYAYAFSGLPRHVLLGAMRHRTKRRLSWRGFEDLLLSAKARLYTCINIHAVSIDSSAKTC